METSHFPCIMEVQPNGITPNQRCVHVFDMCTFVSTFVIDVRTFVNTSVIDMRTFVNTFVSDVLRLMRNEHVVAAATQKT